MMSSMITIDMRMVDSSGIGTYISNLMPLIIEGLPDYEFKLLGDINRLKKYNVYSNVQLIEFKSSIYTIMEQFELKIKIPKETDLFWSPHYNIPIFYNGKLLVTVHDVFHLAMKQYVRGYVKKLYAKFMFHMVKNRADRILTVSNFSKSELEKYLHISEGKIVVTYNGVAKYWFAENINGNPIRRPYLLYVGNVKPHKNLINLIKGYNLIQNKIPYDLVIVGRYEGFITNDTNIKEIRRSNKRVHFTGFVDNDYLKSLVSNAVLFIFPSLYEGFGLPPLEAMACGTPTIVSSIPVLEEICGNSSFYFNPKDYESIAQNIYKLLNDSASLKKLREIGPRHAHRFTWEKCAEKTREVIKNIMND